MSCTTTKRRRVYYDQLIDLEDWLLPVVYQNQPIQLSVRPSTAEELAHRHEQDSRRYKPAQPNMALSGETWTFSRSRSVYSPNATSCSFEEWEEQAKQRCCVTLGSWWQTTRFVQGVFYFGYDERAWTRQQIITSIAKRLTSKVEYLSTFQPLSLEAQQSMLARRLRAERHLLILDNLESITGAHLAIQHTLSKKSKKPCTVFSRSWPEVGPLSC